MREMEIQINRQTIQSVADITNFFICILARRLNPDLKSSTMPFPDEHFFLLIRLDRIVRTCQ